MLIVIDSNLIISDYRLGGTAARSLFDSAKSVGATLGVPRVVLDEVEKSFERALCTATRQLQKAANNLGRLLQHEMNPLHVVEDPSEEAMKYRAWLENKLKRAGGTVLAYPSVSLEAMSRRAAEHRRPFAVEGDRGFKDYLIWETTLTLAKASATSPIILVSENKKDFGDGQGGFHPDLIADLQRAGVKSGRVLLKESLDVVFTEFVLATLQEVEDFAEDLRTSGSPAIEDWIERHLADSVDIEKADGARTVLKREFENPRLEGITRIRDMMFEEIRRLPSGEILVEVEVEVGAEVGFYIFQGDYATLAEEVSATWYDDHYYYGTEDVRLDVNLLLTVDRDREEVTSGEVTRTIVTKM